MVVEERTVVAQDARSPDRSLLVLAMSRRIERCGCWAFATQAFAEYTAGPFRLKDPGEKGRAKSRQKDRCYVSAWLRCASAIRIRISGVET